jgi:hypothetical protein
MNARVNAASHVWKIVSDKGVTRTKCEGRTIVKSWLALIVTAKKEEEG